MRSDLPEFYLRAMRDEPTLGLTSGLRPEPTLDEARAELSEAISTAFNSMFEKDLGPIIGVVSKQVVYEYLRNIEAKVSLTKEHFYVVLSEIVERTLDFNKRGSK